MNYNDFDHEIHALILELGLDYFNKSRVHSLEQTDDGWMAVVQGQQDYKVSIKGGKEVEEWFCDCPYDHGPVCKHVAATLFAIRDKLNRDYSQLLDAYNKDQLMDLIKLRMIESPRFANWVRKHLSE